MKRSRMVAIGLAASALLVIWLRAARRDPSPPEPRAEAVLTEAAPSGPPALQPPAAAASREAARPDAEGAREEDLAARSDDLAVRVVDPSGNAVAGIPLVLVAAGEKKPALATATSDAEGRALLKAVRRDLEAALEPRVVRAEVPFETPPEIAVTSAVLQQDELTFTLPWGGVLEVRVLDADGGPLVAATEAQIAIAPGSGTERPKWSTSLRDGHGAFPWVELDRDWELFVWTGPVSAAILGRGGGPRTPRATARIEVTLELPPATELLLRAVDEHGVPLARVALALELDRGGRKESESVETDAEGRFVVLSAHPFRMPGTLIVRCRLGPADERIGRVDGGHDVRPDDEVVLARAPVLARGRVLDAAGRPVGGATVEASLRFPPAGMRRPFGGFFASPTIVTGSDGDGLFELRGVLSSREFELRASLPAPESEERSPFEPRASPPFESGTVRVSEGASGVELVLYPPSTLSGRVLVSEVPPEVIEVAVMDGERKVVETKPSAVDGSFVFDDVRGGVVRLRFALHDEELARSDDIRIPSADLGAIDLRSLVHRCAITLVGGSDGDEPTGTLTWRACGSDSAWRSEAFNGRNIELVTPHPCLDLWVRPRDHRCVRAEGVTDRLEAALRDPLLVRFVLETDGELPSYPEELVPELWLGGIAEGIAVATPLGPPGFTRETREIVLQVGAAGRLALRWRQDRHSAERGEGHGSAGVSSRFVLANEATEIEVLERAGEQVIPLRLPAAALRALADPALR